MLGVVEIRPVQVLALALVDRPRIAVPEALDVGARFGVGSADGPDGCRTASGPPVVVLAPVKIRLACRRLLLARDLPLQHVLPVAGIGSSVANIEAPAHQRIGKDVDLLSLMHLRNKNVRRQGAQQLLAPRRVSRPRPEGPPAALRSASVSRIRPTTPASRGPVGRLLTLLPTLRAGSPWASIRQLASLRGGRETRSRSSQRRGAWPAGRIVIPV